MPDTAATLNEAYGLIEQGELARARTLLQPLLESDSQNPDVWWVYTHAAEDENEGRRALDRVLALDPQYPGATELRERLGGGPRVLRPISSLKPATTTTPVVPTPISTTTTVTSESPVVSAPLSEPDLDDDDDFAETASTPQRQRLSRILLVVGGIAIILALAWFLLSMLNQTPTPVSTPTAVAGLGTPVETTTLVDALTQTDVVSLVGTTTVDAGTPLTSETLVGEETADPFVQTATALVVTNVSVQAVTDESPVTTDEPVTLATSEATVEATEFALATENALLPGSTEEPAATLEVLFTEEPLVTEEPVATEEVTATEVVVVTEEPIVTEEPTATQTVTDEPTQTTVAPTDEGGLIVPTDDVPAATVDVTPTEETGLILTEEVTAEATQDPADTLAAKLEVLNITRDDIVIAETSLGPTLIVEVCAAPVASATTTLNVTMNALAETVVDVPDVEAVGVNLACEEQRPRVIAVSASEAAAYGRGEIDARTFRLGWQPTDVIDQEGNG